MKAKLFTGCVIPNRLPFLEKSARLVFKDLGIQFIDAPFSCCPDPVGVAAISEETWLTLGARNLALGEKDNQPIVSLCNGCSETLIGVKHALSHDNKSLAKVNDRLKSKGYNYKGDAVVKHFIQNLIEDVGLEKIKKNVKRPLKGLKVATHTGCHYNRPSEIIQWDDPFEPKHLDALVDAVGAESIDYDEKMLCCGSAVARTNDEVAIEVAYRKFKSLTDAGAECIILNCPSCFQQFENTQRLVSKAKDENFKIPILYITEIMALAFGYSPDELGFKFHRIKPKKLLKSIGIE